MTFTGAMLSLFIAWAIGRAIVEFLCAGSSFAVHMIRFVLAIGTGLATTSILLFFWLLAFNGQTAYYALVEAVIGLTLLLQTRYKRKCAAACEKTAEPSSREWTSENPVQERKTVNLFWALFGMAVLVMLLMSLYVPHGQWDAWTIWNMKARFVFRAGENWTQAFSDKFASSHPDYPLLLPLSVTRVWLYSRQETFTGPIITGTVFSAGILLLLFWAVFMFKGALSGIFAAATLASTPYFFTVSVSQYADLPLAFFFLCSLILVAWYARGPSPTILTLAGLCTGFAAWTKNEGLLFVFVLSVFVSIMIWRMEAKASRTKTLGYFVTGLLLPILTVAAFKLTLAPENDLVKGALIGNRNPLLQIERYITIAQFMLTTALNFGNWKSIIYGVFNPIALMTAYLLLAGVQIRSYCNWLLPGVILLMIAGYFFAYLVTPHDLAWHLRTSCNRLFLQLWPCMIFTFFLLSGEEKESFISD